jgi:hypothetical protein
MSAEPGASSDQGGVSSVVRWIAVAFLVVTAFGVAAAATYGVAYRASSGCEDAGIACRDADPLIAALGASLALVAIGGLVFAATRLVRGHELTAARVPVLVAFGSAVLSFVALRSGP